MITETLGKLFRRPGIKPQAGPSILPEQERRSSSRRKVDDHAICIPIEGPEKKAFVVGVEWCHIMMDEPIIQVASRDAKSKACSHIYANGRDSFYGVLNVDAADIKENGELYPLAAAFARSVPDRSARSIYVVDLRDSDDKGWVYFATVQRGVPIKEVLCPPDKYFGYLSNLVVNSETSSLIFVDSEDTNFIQRIGQVHASATRWPLAKNSTNSVESIRKLRALNVTKTQVVLLSLAVAGFLSYSVGIDYYKANLVAKSDEELQQKLLQDYIVGRQQSFNGGYGITPSAATAALDEMMRDQASRADRSGWMFKEAVCSVETGTCTFDWDRYYGTNDSFVQQAKLETLTFDPANFKLIKEQREFRPRSVEKPDWMLLPDLPTFVRDNGDRADTFQLAGIDQFVTDPMQDLVAWTGKGPAPKPQIKVAGWSVEAPIDLLMEAVQNRRIGDEFGVGKLTLTNRDGVFYLKLEGKIYARTI